MNDFFFQNDKCNGGSTPLHDAACFGRVDCVRVLIRRGADVEVGDDDYGRTPLELAEEENKHEAARIIREEGEISVTNRLYYDVDGRMGYHNDEIT